MKQTAGISMRSLTVGYRKAHNTLTVATNIDAEAHASELTCLIGRNGTGKTTLLRTLAGITLPLQGCAEVDGTGIATMTTAQRARTVGIVLTARTVSPRITVAQTVAAGRAPYTNFWGRLTPADREVIGEAMHAVGITAMAQRRMGELSDGEMQKVMIAKALAQQTPVLLLDEPSAFLDYPSRLSLMSLLARLARQGKTVVVSTHDIETALASAHRLWLMHDGTLTAGTPDQLTVGGELEQHIGMPPRRSTDKHSAASATP